jgi:hypothetical protein
MREGGEPGVVFDCGRHLATALGGKVEGQNRAVTANSSQKKWRHFLKFKNCLTLVG